MQSLLFSFAAAMFVLSRPFKDVAAWLFHQSAMLLYFYISEIF